MGSWVGGDRDGNPFVTAEALEEAVTRQAATALGRYLGEVDNLGIELSMSIRLVQPTPELMALAAAAGTSTLLRRRALPGGARGHPRPARRHRRSGAGRGPRRAPAPRSPAALPAPRRAARRPRRGRRLAAQPRGRRAGRRPARPAAPDGRDVRLPPVRARPAAELRRPRAGRRRPAGVGRRHRPLPVARRAGPGGRAGRRAAHPPPAGGARRRRRRAHRATSWPCSGPGRPPSTGSARRHPQLRDLQGHLGQRRARGGAAAQGGRPRLAGRAGVAAAGDRPAVRDHRRPALGRAPR